MFRDCPEPRVFRCHNCDDEGHQARECDKLKDWSRVKCRNCEKYGHGDKRCPNPPTESSGGDWGNGGEDSGAGAGGWSAGGDSGGATTSDWADASTAAAGGDSWAEPGGATASW
jgi:cellular nucleic acid-binding protein